MFASVCLCLKDAAVLPDPVHLVVDFFFFLFVYLFEEKCHGSGDLRLVARTPGKAHASVTEGECKKRKWLAIP